MTPARRAATLALFLGLTVARDAAAQLVQAEPLAPIVAPFPASAPPVETQVALQLVIDAAGGVESALEISRLPREAPDAFVRAAIDAVKAARFTPSSGTDAPSNRASSTSWSFTRPRR